MKRLFTLTTVAVMLTLAGCGRLYGLKQLKFRSNETIRDFAAKYNIPSDQSFMLDTSYLTFMQRLDTTQKESIKNHLQPLQILYFDKAGQLASYHVNCYAGTGLMNLKWDKNEQTGTFIPVSQAPTDSLLNFNRQLQFIRTYDNRKVDTEKYTKADFNVVVYWSVFMGRQSKRLIQFIQKREEQAKGESVNFLFVNNDNIFIAADAND